MPDFEGTKDTLTSQYEALLTKLQRIYENGG